MEKQKKIQPEKIQPEIKEIEVKMLKIQKMNISDIDNLNQISEIFVEIHNENFQNQINKQYFLNIFSNKQYSTYILTKEKNIKNNANILGYIIFYDTVDAIDLFEIAVKSAYHNKGLGNKLLTESLELIFSEEKYKKRSKDEKRVLLEVNENNRSAIALYKKNKFNQIAVRKNYYGQNQNGIIMQKYMEK